MTETAQSFKMILTDMWEDETTRVIGEIAIAFAQLEHVLWVSPKRIRELSMNEWEQIAGESSIPARCRQIQEAHAIRALNQNREGDLLHWLREAERVAKARNSIMHARWGCKKDKQMRITTRHRIWKNKDAGIDHAKLVTLRNDIRRVRDELGRFKW
jgi:hypothetical protein